MQRSRQARLLAGLGLLLVAALARAEAPRNGVGSEQIARLVEQAVRTTLEGSSLARGANGIEVRVGALDTRLRLAACATPLAVEADPVRANGRLNARVSCRGAEPWSIWVPVEVSVHRDVVVTTRALERGQAIGADDVALEERDVLAGGGRVMLRLEEAIGRTPRRSLPAHAALNAASVELPVLVRRGDRLNLAARAGGITVTATAEAMSDGRSGEQIRVRNLQSRRVVDATVTGPGAAEAI
jgi:flagella basal body P-ring formation protein FlgA